MSKAEHDKLAFRLTQILVKLNQGEKLDPEALAQEFAVNARTIQRDLNDRFSYLPLEKSQGRYHLHPTYLGKLSLRDLEQFACLAGVRGLFPGLSSEFLRSFLDSRVQAAFLVKGPHYEDVSEKIPTFQQLEHAINNRHLVGFEYHKTEASKAYDDLEPYKLVNDGGIWYLAAKDGNTLKAFTFSKIDRLRISEAVFQPDPTVAKTLLAEDGIWLNPRKTEVVLKVAKEAASYFRQRNLIPHQVVTKELSDGGLIVSGRVAHANQILPTVRQWIPSVRIISPEGLQTEMETVIQTYLAGH